MFGYKAYVPTDIAFLDVDSYELNLRIAFLQSFLKVFGDEKHKAETARNALNKILQKEEKLRNICVHKKCKVNEKNVLVFLFFGYYQD